MYIYMYTTKFTHLIYLIHAKLVQLMQAPVWRLYIPPSKEASDFFFLILKAGQSRP